jgi:hypothetical protein
MDFQHMMCSSYPQIAHTLRLFQQHVSEAPASFNNSIGVAMTALGLPLDNDVAVFEIGTSQQGEISSLTRIVRPHIRVITDVQPAHLAGFETQDVAAVLDEKLQLFKLARQTDALVFNASNRGVWESLVDQFGIGAASRPVPHSQQPLWAFGVEGQLCSETLHDLNASLPGLGIIVARDVRSSLQLEQGSARWKPQTSVTLCLHECGHQQQHMGASCDALVEGATPSQCISVCVPALGQQIGANSALALATTCAWMDRQSRVGTATDSRDGHVSRSRSIAEQVMRRLDTHAWLQSWTLPPGRMTMHQLRDGVIVLDDGYNANPASMLSALRTVRDLQATCNGEVKLRRLCVLGYMAELGEQEQKYHQQVFEVLQQAMALKETCTSAILWGRAWLNVVVDSVPAENLECITWHADNAGSVSESVLRWLKTSPEADSYTRTLDVVMLKGSRKVQVERVLDRLQQYKL